MNLLKQIFEFLKNWKQHQTKDHRKLMTAIDNLTASVNALNASLTALTAAVDTAVVDITVPGATDAQLLTLQGVVDTVKAGYDAQTARLNAATAPVVTPPPVTP